MTADWTRRAACNGQPLNLWFPEGGTSPDAAKDVCFNACPVRTECLEFALTTHQTEGIWGGLEPRERRNQRTYRVVYCGHCGRRFTWMPDPEGGVPAPRFCSGLCRSNSRVKTRAESHQRRKLQAAG